jgi:hypothetical protein
MEYGIVESEEPFSLGLVFSSSDETARTAMLEGWAVSVGAALESVATLVAGFAGLPESAATSVAGFACRPPGNRTAIPAAFK